VNTHLVRVCIQRDRTALPTVGEPVIRPPRTVSVSIPARATGTPRRAGWGRPRLAMRIRRRWDGGDPICAAQRRRHSNHAHRWSGRGEAVAGTRSRSCRAKSVCASNIRAHQARSAAAAGPARSRRLPTTSRHVRRLETIKGCSARVQLVSIEAMLGTHLSDRGRHHAGTSETGRVGPSGAVYALTRHGVVGAPTERGAGGSATGAVARAGPAPDRA